jgi:hypothetical protein
MSSVIGELIYKIKGDTSDAQRNVDAFEKRFKDVGKKLTKTGKTLTLAVTLPIAGIGIASVKAASDFEETEAKFNTAFKGIEKRADETAKTLAKGYLLSEKESKRLLSSTGDLLKGFGFTADNALDLSNKVQELSADLASYNNLAGGTTQASEILTKALLGERDALTTLGVKVSEVDVQNKLYEKGQQNLTGQTLLAAKAQATYELVLGQSGDALGDVARTSDSFANQMRAAKADVENLAVEIGKELLPIARDLLSDFRGLIGVFKDLSPEGKRFALTLAGMAAAVGPLLLIVGKRVAAIAAFNPITGVIVAAVAAVGLLTAAWLEYKSAADKAAQASKDLEEQFGSKKATEYTLKIVKLEKQLKKWEKELGKVNDRYGKNTNLAKASTKVIQAQIKPLEDQIEKLEKLKKTELERVGFFDKTKKSEEAKNKRTR